MQVEYLIKFKGYDDSENSWEPVENLNCSRMIKKYERSLKMDKSRNSRKISEFFEYESIIGKRIVDGKVSFV